jgi:two-component system phosphate regulon sensor histidine kinase PhoR
MDENAITLLILNLVDNAIKYAADGKEVMVSVARSPGGVVIAVRDFGPGIAVEEQTRVFERFYRADAGRSRDQGGTGIGLAIVKHLVQAQGGEVGVESGAGGSRFWVRLPEA